MSDWADEEAEHIAETLMEITPPIWEGVPFIAVALKKAMERGRKVGLEEAARWHEGIAETCRRAMAEAGVHQSDRFGIRKHRNYATAIRALATREGAGDV